MSKMKRIYEEITKGEDIEFMKFCQRENEREHEKQMLELFEKMEESK
jgi:hypothetical protein